MSTPAMKKAKAPKGAVKGRKGLKWEYSGWDCGWHARAGKCFLEVYTDKDGAYTYMMDGAGEGIMFVGGSVSRAKKRVEAVVAAILEANEGA